MSTVQAIGALILRIIGLYFIITGLPMVGIYVGMYLNPPEGGWPVDGWPNWPGLIYQISILAAALLAFFLAKPLARLLTPAARQPGAPAAPVSPDELVRMGSFLLGLLILVWRLPGLVIELARHVLARMQNLDAEGAVTYSRFFDPWSVAEQAIILLIAFWLFLRPGTLAGLYRWLRRAGPPVGEAGQIPKSG
jgi:hypothetical protein